MACCCVFMDLGLDGDTLDRALNDAGALRSVHAAFAAAQDAVYAYEGAVNKFLHDDKGSTLIACWGLPLGLRGRRHAMRPGGAAGIRVIDGARFETINRRHEGRRLLRRYRVHPAARVHSSRGLHQPGRAPHGPEERSDRGRGHRLRTLTVEALGEVWVKGPRARGRLPTFKYDPRHSRRGPRLHHTVVVSKATRPLPHVCARLLTSRRPPPRRVSPVP